MRVKAVQWHDKAVYEAMDIAEEEDLEGNSKPGRYRINRGRGDLEGTPVSGRLPSDGLKAPFRLQGCYPCTEVLSGPMRLINVPLVFVSDGAEEGSIGGDFGGHLDVQDAGRGVHVERQVSRLIAFVGT